MFFSLYGPWFWPINWLQENVPLLHALVNPGLRQRHWTEISNVIGFEMGPDPTMTLNKARYAPRAGHGWPWMAMATPGDRSVIKKGESPHGFVMGKWWGNDGKVMDHLGAENHRTKAGASSSKPWKWLPCLEGTWIPADRWIGGKSWTSEQYLVNTSWTAMNS